MSLGRRAFLKAGLGTGAAAAAFPAWSAALAQPAGTDGDAVAEGLRAARAIGKPVLVLLIPGGENSAEQGLRMTLWSQLLAVADDATLAELALCEVVCARTSDVAAGARAAKAVCPELGPAHVAVLLETDGEPGQPVSGEGLPEIASVHRDASLVDEYEASVRDRAAKLAARVRRAILPDESALSRRAAAAQATFDMRVAMQTSLEHYPRPILAQLDRGAAIVLADARATGGAEGAAKEANLARAALQRLWEDAPHGAGWSTTTGYCPPCGMGFTPAISRHFLSFYAR